MRKILLLGEGFRNVKKYSSSIQLLVQVIHFLDFSSFMTEVPIT